MVDTLKTIHDTLYIHGTDGMDILNKVDEFYNSSWNKLLYILGIGGAVIGVGVPYVINRMQKTLIKISEKELKTEIEKKLREEIEKQEQNLIQVVLHTKEGLYCIQAMANISMGEVAAAYVDIWNALDAEVMIGDLTNIGKNLKLMCEVCLPNLSTQEIQEAVISRRAQVNTVEVINKLIAIDTTRAFSKLIEEMMNMLRSLPLTKEERLKREKTP